MVSRRSLECPQVPGRVPGRVPGGLLPQKSSKKAHKNVRRWRNKKVRRGTSYYWALPHWYYFLHTFVAQGRAVHPGPECCVAQGRTTPYHTVSSHHTLRTVLHCTNRAHPRQGPRGTVPPISITTGTFLASFSGISYFFQSLFRGSCEPCFFFLALSSMFSVFLDCLMMSRSSLELNVALGEGLRGL